MSGGTKKSSKNKGKAQKQDETIVKTTDVIAPAETIKSGESSFTVFVDARSSSVDHHSVAKLETSDVFDAKSTAESTTADDASMNRDASFIGEQLGGLDEDLTKINYNITTKSPSRPHGFSDCAGTRSEASTASTRTNSMNNKSGLGSTGSSPDKLVVLVEKEKITSRKLLDYVPEEIRSRKFVEAYKNQNNIASSFLQGLDDDVDDVMTVDYPFTEKGEEELQMEKEFGFESTGPGHVPVNKKPIIPVQTSYSPVTIIIQVWTQPWKYPSEYLWSFPIGTMIVVLPFFLPFMAILLPPLLPLVWFIWRRWVPEFGCHHDTNSEDERKKLGSPGFFFDSTNSKLNTVVEKWSEEFHLNDEAERYPCQSFVAHLLGERLYEKFIPTRIRNFLKKVDSKWVQITGCDTSFFLEYIPPIWTLPYILIPHACIGDVLTFLSFIFYNPQYEGESAYTFRSWLQNKEEKKEEALGTVGEAEWNRGLYEALGLDWMVPGGGQEPKDSSLIVILHGLAGGSSANYSIAMCQEFAKLGHYCVCMNARGMGDTPIRGGSMYNPVRTCDVRATVHYCQKLWKKIGNGKIHLCATSSGGATANRLVMLDPYFNNELTSVVSLCGAMKTHIGKYDRRSCDIWMPPLQQAWVEHFRPFAHFWPAAGLPQDVYSDKIRATNIPEWEKVFLAPYLGFGFGDEGHENYHKSYTVPFESVKKCPVPIFISHALDDQILTAEAMDEIRDRESKYLDNSNALVNLTAYGGHVGWTHSTPWGKKIWPYMLEICRSFFVAVEASQQSSSASSK